LPSVRSVHAAGGPFLMSAMVTSPAFTERSPQRRSEDQYSILCLGSQNLLGEPPRRTPNGRPHHRQPELLRLSVTRQLPCQRTARFGGRAAIGLPRSGQPLDGRSVLAQRNQLVAVQ